MTPDPIGAMLAARGLRQLIAVRHERGEGRHVSRDGIGEHPADLWQRDLRVDDGGRKLPGRVAALYRLVRELLRERDVRATEARFAAAPAC